MKKFTESIKTPCQTPDMIYNIEINSDEIEINLKFPFSLEIDEEEAKILESNLHNSIEIVLSKYFTDKD